MPLEQNGVCHLIRTYKIDLMGVLEVKHTSNKLINFMEIKFVDWKQITSIMRHVEEGSEYCGTLMQ